jgi:cellulose synthase/poly-beta-1,6-N-acetylglucosamine synthase-like glycosyltransferase
MALPVSRRPTASPDVAATYRELSELTGPLTTPLAERQAVQFRRVLSAGQRIGLTAFILLNLVASIGYLAWLLQPAHFPATQPAGGGIWLGLGAIGFILLATTEIVRIAQNATTWLFAWMMRDPVPMQPQHGLRVAVLTTIVPSREPLAIVARTLRAMCRLRYDGIVDVWILDEGDDPAVRRVAAELGVRHFSRKGRPEYNRPSGAFKARTKAGNHNAWRAEYEGDYDVVAQMDPDHVPGPDFLIRTLGYFRDPDVAFVVAPQVYGNLHESFVVCGAADQSYEFHGVIQRGANGLGAPLLIGTNHVYRAATWSQIGGYQDSVIEDHLTSMQVHATLNPRTGQPWKGVYTPDILAVGEGPCRWTDYFNQQRRWAYGIWDVMLRHSPRLLPHLSLRRRLSYVSLQLFYPSLGVLWLVGNALTALSLLLGITVIQSDPLTWAALWGVSVLGQLALFVWLRRFNLAEHERRGVGATGILLYLAVGPVYAAAAAAALVRRPLVYIVTAKGTAASRDTWATFRLHLCWLVGVLGLLAVSVVAGPSYLPLRAWACFTLAAVSLPLVMFWFGERRAAWAERRRPRLLVSGDAEDVVEESRVS